MAVNDIVRSEALGIFVTEKTVEILACVSEFLTAREKQRIIADLNGAAYVAHALMVEIFPYGRIHKEKLCLGVADKMMNVVGLEVVKNWYSDSAVSKGRKSSDGPLGRVAPAERYFVTGPEVGILEQKMQLSYFASHIAILKRLAFKVGERQQFPVMF